MSDVLFKRVNGVQIAYRATGSGEPLVLLHGGEADHAMFRDVVAHLERSFLTITYDQRDCGASVSDDDSPYGLTDLADEAAGLIEALGLSKAHVLGHSAGGLVAQVLACRSPERVDKLILEATLPVTLANAAMEDSAFKERLQTMSARGPAGMAEFFSSADYVKSHPEIIDRLGELRGRQTPDQLARRMQALRAVPEIALEKIGAETLVLYAEVDQAASRAAAEEMARTIPKARFEVYPAAGHIGIIQFPEGYAEVISNFLNA